VKIQKVQALFEPGSVTFPEDRLFLRPFSPEMAFVGVADGVSGLYIPSEGPRLFSEGTLTGGQMVTDTICHAFTEASRNDSLEEIILRANDAVAAIQIANGKGIPIERSDLLAGAAFAVAKIGEEVEILQAGDCFAFWKLQDGEIGATRNQVYQHDMVALEIVAQLMEKHGGDRNKMWRELSPILSEMRLQHVNKNVEGGYALCNGQPELENCWQKITIPSDRLSFLILATDGLIHYPESGDEKALARKVLTLFQKESLEAVLAETRRIEEREKGKSYADKGEATAIAIEFSS